MNGLEEMRKAKKDFRKMKRAFIADILKLKESEVTCSNCSAEDNKNCKLYGDKMDPNEYCNLFLPKGTD